VCFSLAWFVQMLIILVVLCGVIAILRIWVFPMMGSVDSRIPATINTPLDVTPLSAADAADVVQVDISFTSRPTRATVGSPRDAVFQQSIFFRTADPMDPGKGPKCQ